MCRGPDPARCAARPSDADSLIVASADDRAAAIARRGRSTGEMLTLHGSEQMSGPWLKQPLLIVAGCLGKAGPRAAVDPRAPPRDRHTIRRQLEGSTKRTYRELATGVGKFSPAPPGRSKPLECFGRSSGSLAYMG
jgi:hypothetical protein